MRSRGRSATFAAAAMLGLLLAAGCGTAGQAPRTGGPLALGGGNGRLCLPRHTGSPEITYGFEALRNKGQTPVKLGAVKLVNAHGLRLEHAYLVPVTGDLIGAWSYWPPPHFAVAPTQWDQRTSLAGSRIAPGPKTYHNVVLRLALAPSGSPGFDAVQVGYTAGGHRYLARSSTRLVIRDRC